MKNFLNTLCIFLRRIETLLSNKHLLVSKNIHSNGNTSFHSNITELSKSNNLPDFVPNNLDKTKISKDKV